jgi:hypothetical protein
MIFEPDTANLGNAGRTVASEYESNHFGDWVVEFFTLHRVAEILAFRTSGRCESMVAGAYRTPSSLDVPMATGALALAKTPAGTTVKPASGDKV